MCTLPNKSSNVELDDANDPPQGWPCGWLELTDGCRPADLPRRRVPVLLVPKWGYSWIRPCHLSVGEALPELGHICSLPCLCLP